MERVVTTVARLRALVTVADAGSVREAARRLTVTESAVSAALSALAREVRVPLVERDGRGLRLTASGQAYSAYARTILGLHEEGLAAARGDQDPERGRVRVAATTTAGEYLLPTALASFLRQHPVVDLRLEVGSSERLWALFAAHEADLVIGGRPPGHAGDARICATRPNLLVVVAAPAVAADFDIDRTRWLQREDQTLDSLESDLVGLEPVKTRVREIAALLLVDRARSRFGLSAGPPSLHMCFTGNPGTGKTTVALRMAELLHRLGYLRRGHVVSVTRDDLVGQYVGHTAPKTRDAINRAMGGVLFIDEAYYLYRAENERDYGQESIEILLQYMENHRADLVVIMAGYADRMETFFASNPGMSSRIAHHLEFPDYSLDELVAIGELMLREQRYRLSAAAEATFRDYLARRMTQPRFANARSVRNALERARLRHANRLIAADGALAKDDLMRLEPADFLASRVFSGPHG